MASIWEASVTLVDADEKRSSLRIKMGEIDGVDFPGEAAVALANLTAFITDLKAASMANVLTSRLYVLDQGGVDGTIPANESDVSDEAVLIVHTNDTNYPSELATLRIPAPEDDLFVNDDPAQGLDVGDTTNTDYVANFTANLEISDGEHVNAAEGTSGIHSGYWRSVAKKIA